MSFNVYGGRHHQSGHPYRGHNQDGAAARVWVGDIVQESDPARADFIAGKLAALRGVAKETILREFDEYDRAEEEEIEERRIA